MTSIRRQLIFRLLVGLLLLFIGASVVLFVYARNGFVDQFDEALTSKMLAFTGMCEMEYKSGILKTDMEFDEYPLPEFQPSEDAEYYQVWSKDNLTLVRSPSLGEKELPRFDVIGNQPVIQDILLPDNRKGRAIGTWFFPIPDPDSIPQITEEQIKANGMFMVMAKSREKLDTILFTLSMGYLITGVLLTLGVVVILKRSVKKGLAPLDHMARETSTIEPDNLTYRFDTKNTPQELVPICNRLNELLTRLEAAFIRERRFTGDIAHELRTPLAELRVLAEVSLKREEDSQYFEVSKKCFQDALDIARQMEKLVTTLLAIVRQQNNESALKKEKLDPLGLVEKLAQPFLKTANERKIAFEMTLDKGITLYTDKILFSSMLNNLFSNAVNHTPENGRIQCEARVRDNVFVFILRNTNGRMAPEDLEFIFEPLWQKTQSRSRISSHGLGLSLVAMYGKLLGMEIKAALPEPELFEISLKCALE